MERLQGLARSHDLILDQRLHSADLRALVLQSVEGYRISTPERITLQGESVLLPPQQVLGLGLALHELSTNAAKYGGLSGPHGRVAIGWEIVPVTGVKCLRLNWREYTMHTINPPTRRGFGTKLIERICTQELDGEFEMDFAPEGLNVSVTFPLNPARQQSA
jgi:two-component sensor histidine kinase